MKRWAEDLATCLMEGNAAKALLMLRCGFPLNTPMRAALTGEDLGGKTYCAHIAAQRGLVAVLRQLLDSPDSLEQRNSAGCTPFLVACKYGEFEAIQFLALTAKVNTTVTDLQGNTAVHLATANVHKEIVEYLVEQLKLSPSERNNDGELPADICERVARSASSAIQVRLEALAVFLKSKYTAPLTISTSPVARKSRQKPHSNASLTPIARTSTGGTPVRLNLRSSTPIDRLIRDRCKIVYSNVQNKRVQPLKRLQDGERVGLRNLFSPGFMQS